MRGKISGFAALLCLAAALLAFPALALANGSASISGTITAGGHPVPAIAVTVFEYHEYSFTDGWWEYVDSEVTTAGGTFSLDVANPSGGYTGTFCVRATDAVGTYAPARTSGFKLAAGQVKRVGLVLGRDSTPPVVSADRWSNLVRMVDAKTRTTRSVQALSAPNGYATSEAYSSENVELRLRAMDYVAEDGFSDVCGSGVAAFYYSINRSAYRRVANPALASLRAWDWSNFSEDLTISKDGVSAIRYYAVDKAGNASAARTTLVYVDKIAPTTTYDKHAATGKTIKLIAKDGASGVAGTWWRFGTTAEFTQGTSVRVPAKGIGRLQYYSLDRAGNAGAIKSLAVRARARATTPRVSDAWVTGDETLYVTGSIKPRARATGSIRIYRWSDGKYRYAGKKKFKENKAGIYKVAFKLESGTYKFRAFYGANTATSSNPPVRSRFSSRARVRD